MPPSSARTARNHFYAMAHAKLIDFHPQHYIAMTSADPFCYTPGIKALLRYKNSLMRAGRLEEALACATQISRTIAKRKQSHLRNIDARHTAADLCQQLSLTLQNLVPCLISPPTSPQTISTPTMPASPQIQTTDHPPSDRWSMTTKSQSLINKFSTFSTTCTTPPPDTMAFPPGTSDLLPPTYCSILSHFINQSFSQFHVLFQWKTSIIHPITR